MKKGKVDALLGIVFGDEGKGKVVDVFTPEYDVVARFAGGPNAGHTIIFEGKKFVLRSIPSGIFAKDKVNIIGNGCVIAPDLFMAEAKELEAAGYDLKGRLHISKRAHLILPTHRVLDRAYEAAKGKAKVGTTGKGIGPTYSDKAARIGLRVGDILDRFEEKYAALKARHKQILKDLHYTDYDITDEEKLWLEGVEYLRGFHLTDTEIEINRYLKEGKNVLAEGAQGTMLDIDHGTYPFVSSSNTTSGGVCTGLGVGPTDIREVFGIFKAYSTRVGSGPFPVELFDETGDTLREVGHEYGAVTGRNRRCGWVDLVALKYAIMINGVTQLIMMKSDVVRHHQGVRGLQERRRGDGRHAFRDGRLRSRLQGTSGLEGRLVAHDGREPVPASFQRLHPFPRNGIGDSDYDPVRRSRPRTDHRTQKIKSVS